MRVSTPLTTGALIFTLIGEFPPTAASASEDAGATDRLLSYHHGIPQLSAILRHDTNFDRGTLWSEGLQKRLLEKIQVEEESKGDDSNATASDGANERDLQLNAENGCSSQLFDWAHRHVRAMGFANYRAITDEAYNITMMPYVYKLYLDGDNSGEYFGKDRYGGRVYTETLIENHKKSEQFWESASVDTTWEEYGPTQDRPVDVEVQKGDVLLLGMHGSDLSVETNLFETIRFMFTHGVDINHGDGDGILSDKEVKELSKDISALVEGLPGKWDNPMLTLNAMASEGGFVTSMTGEEKETAQENDKQDKGNKKKDGEKKDEVMDIYVPDSLLIGDGILQFLDDIGLSNTGPIFVHSHEFGHLLQFNSVKYIGGNTPMSHETRRVELMADAFASYYLSHPNGKSSAVEEVVRLTDAAFSLGDCNVDSDWHHGTPDQRRCAATWGSMMAKSRGRKVLHPEVLSRRFDQVLKDLIALDPQVCLAHHDGNEGDTPSKPAADEPVTTAPTSKHYTYPPKQLPTWSPSMSTPTQGPIEPMSVPQSFGPSISPKTKSSQGFGSDVPSVSPSLYHQHSPSPSLPIAPFPSLRPMGVPILPTRDQPPQPSHMPQMGIDTMGPTFSFNESVVVASIDTSAKSSAAEVRLELLVMRGFLACALFLI
mmetsp:Transcript_3018/g.7859  ORF Transcript_3018/g.7859 Transcript_3018/m.7859 type:complete len:656 (-) Transcript_3018:366-2333(-)|eukprot:CAMPEP_0113557124 /NCGR_PEP_ID=MMETSP0015_2-20120614/17619_1 /TAXON_ID=2838 /ORGANISM="Odontella" /LENGTH=655 /DNA_ID=CAMNT_0000458519 /DNA_START=200 /DNA_END=2167 /DNA_ORIENTATION=- /assembly_acc=CAM_ASM_000160